MSAALPVYTPGPLVVEAGPKGDPDVADADFIVAEKSPFGEVIATFPGPIARGTPEGNARLFAVAGELLETAKDAQCACTVRERDSGHLVGCWMPALTAVIDKAEGR